MAIQYVGGQVALITVVSPATHTITFALTGGIASTPAVNDFVIVTYAEANVSDIALSGRISTSGYALVTELYSNDSNDANLAVFRKFMNGTPDASVEVVGATDAAAGVVVNIQVFRGVNTTTPFDATATTATGGNTGNANPPPITPVTTGNFIVPVGSAATGTFFRNFTTTSTAYMSGFIQGNQPDTTGAVSGSGHISGQAAGVSYNPAAWAINTDSIGNSWCAATMALRPAVVVTGTAASIINLTGSASGAVSEAPSAIEGIAAGTLDLTGTASADAIIAGASSGILELTGAGSGAAIIAVSASGDFPLSGSASGLITVTSTGNASDTLPLTGNASGTVIDTGTVTGTLSLIGTATGAMRVKGLASGSLPLTGTTTGNARVTAASAGVLPITGAATGAMRVKGLASGSLNLAGATLGIAPVAGRANGALPLVGISTGKAKPIAIIEIAGSIRVTTIAGAIIRKSAPGLTHSHIAVGRVAACRINGCITGYTINGTWRSK